MRSWAKIRAGAVAKANGDAFESIFLRMCRLNGVAVTQIPSGCRRVGGNRLIPVKTPWDWVCSYNSQTALIDTKSTQEANFPCSMISEHQVRELLQHELRGAIAGYVIWLRKSDRVFFIKASALSKLQQERGSFCDDHPGATFLGNIAFDLRGIFSFSPSLSAHPLLD